MQRVVILGPGGAGKSELARELSRRAGLPVTHLDVLFWQEGWTPTPRDEAVAHLAAVVASDRWIIDGNFLQSVADDGRFEHADTVILLDLSRILCLWRISKRFIRDRNRRRLTFRRVVTKGLIPRASSGSGNIDVGMCHG